MALPVELCQVATFLLETQRQFGIADTREEVDGVGSNHGLRYGDSRLRTSLAQGITGGREPDPGHASRRPITAVEGREGDARRL